MKTKHSYVTLIDLPEALPFEVRLEKKKAHSKAKKSKVKEILTEGSENTKKIFEFIELLEKAFGEEFSYIGEDIVGDKFYKRFLFPKGGFLEIMTQAPAAIIAHFIETKRAKKFATSLKKVITKTIEDKTSANILKGLVEVASEKEEPLTYEKWSELKEIRKIIG
jgi:hypothetical protein